jgi:hypothetical protein
LRTNPTVSVSSACSPAAERDLARERVERREQPVLDEHVGRPAHAAQHRRLARVRVADERRPELRLAPRPLHLARALHAGEPVLQHADAVADQPAVRLELRLAGAAHADAAAELLEVRPHARQPRQHVLQLRELHLELGLVRPRARGEDVEDQLGPVHHAHADRLLDVLPLRGAQLVVEQHERRVERARLVAQLVELPLAEVRGRMGAVELLRERAHDVGAGRVGQARELLEVLLDVVAVRGALEGGADEHDTLGRRGDGDQVAGDRDDSCEGGLEARAASARRRGW